jgi:hypothetical protein
LRAQPVSLPLVFEANRGQADAHTQFLGRATGYTVLVRDREIALRLNSRNLAASTKNRSSLVRKPNVSVQSDTLALEFLGARRRVQWDGGTLLPGHVNYLLGNDSRRWLSGVPLYANLDAPEMYPGVSVQLRADGTALEYDVSVSPGAQAEQVGMAIRGARHIRLDSGGNLRANIAGRELVLHAPNAYQDGPQGRQLVNARFLMAGKQHWRAIRFQLGRYDHRRPLIIDPTISVTYTTFLGGTGADSGNGIAVDSNSNVYIGGTTTALNFPETPTAQLGPGGDSDLFFAKLNPAQSGAASLIYLTYVGGSSNDTGGWIGVGPAGDLAFLGVTTSLDFPVTNGSTRTSGANDMVVGKLNAAGSNFVYSTYFGGNGAEDNQLAAGVSVAPNGAVWITSDTTSTNLPVTTGAFQGANGGGISDGFFAEFDVSAPTVLYCSYLGIDAQVGSAGIAADDTGDVFLAGFTTLPGGATFPVKNAYQGSYPGGTFDGFVMEFTPEGSGANDLDYATYLGGSTEDEALAIAVDSASPPNAYITGFTMSQNFPTNGGVAPYQNMLAGFSNAFVTAFSEQLGQPVTLNYSTYLGGSNHDTGLGIASTGRDSIFVTGSTNSIDFPALAAVQSFTGTFDGFLAKFDSTQSGQQSFIYSTFLGGNSTTITTAVASNNSGNIFVTGNTLSPDYPSGNNTENGVQLFCDSCSLPVPLTDAILTAFLENDAPSPEVEFQPSGLIFGPQLSNIAHVTLEMALFNEGALPLTINGISIEGANAGDFSQTNTCNTPLNTGQDCFFTVEFSPTAEGVETAELAITDNSPGTFHSAALQGTGIEPLGEFNPTSLNFGSLPQGEMSSPLSVTITNAGNAALQFGSITISQPNPPAFAFGGNDTCQGVLNAGQSCMLSAVFTPPALGQFSGNIVIQDNNQNNPAATQMVALSGTGVTAQPLVSLIPAMLAFGSEAAGNTSGPQIIGLKNTGSLPLVISSIAITGANALEFNFVAADTTCPLLGGNVAAGAICNIGVDFAPISVGAKTASVSVTDNAAGSPQQVPLTGNGVAPTAAISPSKLAFGNETVGSTTAAQIVTLMNTGNVPLAIQGIFTGGANPADFVVAQNNCPSNLNPATSCLVSVVFDPQAAGARAGVLNFQDNAQGSPQTVALSGIGISPGLALNPSTLSFPSQLMGVATTAAVKVTNTETTSLTLTQISFSGANAGDFSETDNCIGMLDGGATCKVTVTFTPAAAGMRSAMLSFSYGSSGGPQTLVITGTGSNFMLGSANGTTSASVSAGQTATYMLQANPLDGFTGTINLSCGSAPAGPSCSASPTAVTISGSSGAVAFTVSVVTSAGTAPGMVRHLPPMRAPLVAWAALILLFLAGLLSFSARSHALSRRLRLAAALGLLGWMAACGGGGGGGGGAPSGESASYTVTVTGTDQGVSRTLPLTLTVQQ